MKPFRIRLSGLLAAGLLVLSVVFLFGMVGSLISLKDSRRAVVDANQEIRVVLDLIDAINHTRTSRVWLVQAAALTGSGKFDEGKKAIGVAEQKLQASRDSAERYLKVALASDAAEQGLAEAYRASYQAYVNEGVKPLIQSLKTGDVATYMATLRDRTGQLDRAFEKALDASLTHRESKGKEKSQQVERDFNRNLRVTVALGVLFFVSVALLYLAMHRFIVVPLHAVSDELQLIADRDFTERATARSPLELVEVRAMLDCLHRMRSSLGQAIGSIAGGAESVGSASSEIAAGAVDLSNRTERQAARLQEAAASIQDITVKIDDTARAADEAHRVVQDAVASAESGNRQVAEAIGNILSIQKASNRIKDINAVIDGIAFQTNILALNAAVEAARAGDQGRGFAVVATEVRALANRSAEAAKQISEIIQETIGIVDEGVRVVNETGSAIGQTLGGIAQVSGLMNEIREATGSQSSKLAGVSLSINELDDMTQQNAALVEQNSAAADSLKQQAMRLNATVGEFRLS